MPRHTGMCHAAIYGHEFFKTLFQIPNHQVPEKIYTRGKQANSNQQVNHAQF
jgi:hypothetical protein